MRCPEPVRIRLRLVLEPVALDRGGATVPVDRLTYAEAKELAEKSVWKTYRINPTEDENRGTK